MTQTKKATALTIAKEADTDIVEQETPAVNQYNIGGYLEMRKEFITQVNKIMVEGKDYHVIQNKKSLAKGGAEKIASIFGWSATFRKDEDVAVAFSEIKGLIAFVCNLTKKGESVGEGRGAATLGKNNSDPNKTIKMAQKSAFIDAVLRASGLSDFFTQDLEDMPKDQISQSPAATVKKPEYYCLEHDNTINFVPAGISKKTGKPYDAFYICSQKGCRAPIVDSEGREYWNNPATRQFELKAPQGDIPA